MLFISGEDFSEHDLVRPTLLVFTISINVAYISDDTLLKFGVNICSNNSFVLLFWEIYVGVAIGGFGEEDEGLFLFGRKWHICRNGYIVHERLIQSRHDEQTN